MFLPQASGTALTILPELKDLTTEIQGPFQELSGPSRICHKPD